MTTTSKASQAQTDSATGFTMLELLVAIAIVGLLMAVTVPGSIKFYQSIEYRQGVRDVLTLLGSARQIAIDHGRIQDVAFDPRKNSISLGEERQQLPDGFSLSVTTAGEVNRDGVGIIRFYPEGGSSGGDVSITTPTGRGVTITVDWLMGGVRQVVHDG